MYQTWLFTDIDGETFEDTFDSLSPEQSEEFKQWAEGRVLYSKQIKLNPVQVAKIAFTNSNKSLFGDGGNKTYFQGKVDALAFLLLNLGVSMVELENIAYKIQMEARV